MTLDRKAAARVLREIAGLMELHDENPHRVRALANASRTIERIDGDLEAMIRSSEILDVRGIGKGVAAILTDLVEGRSPEALIELDRRTPPGVKEMLGVSGLGPKKVRTLWNDLAITGLGELEYACRENRLVTLPGFGPASQKNTLKAVTFLRSSRESRLVHQAWDDAESLRRLLMQAGRIDDVLVAGDLRRGMETVGDLECVAIARRDDAGDAVSDILSHSRNPENGVWEGESGDGLPVRIRIVADDLAGAALLWSTGSEAHITRLQALASTAGFSLDEMGIRNGNERLPCATEEELYAALGCRFIAPELRNDGTEVDQALGGAPPELIREEDIRGALHNHTTDSDGSASVEEMARAAGRLGWEFLGFGDHSPAAHYANGVDADRLKSQWQVIDTLNRRGDLPRLVKGLEADILPDGSLDVPEGCEDGLEYVVASVHSSFRLARSAQTERILTAVRNPLCRVLGHPTGRLLLARSGYEIDLERILEACAETGVAAEINASPYRLDLDSEWTRKAIERGVQMVINPDAHSVEGLEDVKWGITVARRAGATAHDIVNCGDIEQWLRSKK